MLQYVNYRMRITILDGRVLVGTLMAFDRHLNLVSLQPDFQQQYPVQDGVFCCGACCMALKEMK